MFYCMAIPSSPFHLHDDVIAPDTIDDIIVDVMFIIQVPLPLSLASATADTLTFCASLYPHDQEDVLLE